MVALPVPALEVRVPPEWQSQMSARALSQNEPATPRNLQLTCSRVVERMVETNSTLSVPAFVWEFVCSEHAGHPQREGMLASITSGVEKEWKAHVVVRLLGELCGMLEHDLSPHVNRRILALLRGGLGCGIRTRQSPRSSAARTPCLLATPSPRYRSCRCRQGGRRRSRRRCGSWGAGRRRRRATPDMVL